MKKLLFIITIIAVMLFSAVTVFAIEGDGTEETPFLITNQEELELVTDFPDCHFKLVNDIELEGTWVPLCKATSTGRFTGVFDGNGHTISNVQISTNGPVGLFYYNYGVIQNVVVKGEVIATSFGAGGICTYNYGSVSRCRFEGKVEGYDAGGICINNYGVVEQCGVLGNIQCKGNTYQYYAGGICGYNKKTISDCYFVGTVTFSAASSSTPYVGGVAGDTLGTSSSDKAYITNCYAVPTFSTSGGGGITGHNDSYTSLTASYYDKTVSGLSNTSHGTPKSTAAMKMKQTYINDWDFETVWGIDKNINDGYPYLLWEYPDVEEEPAYIISNMTITDLSGQELTEIPDSGFYIEIEVTKNDNSPSADSLIIAAYDENNNFVDLKFMKAAYYQNQTINFGTMMNNSDKKISKIKCFVWDNVSTMIPLSNTLEKQ